MVGIADISVLSFPLLIAPDRFRRSIVLRQHSFPRHFSRQGLGVICPVKNPLRSIPVIVA